MCCSRLDYSQQLTLLEKIKIFNNFRPITKGSIKRICVRFSLNVGDFCAERTMEWMIRAVFDLLFMMCHLIASVSPYHILLMRHIIARGEGLQEENRRKRKDWRLGRGGGTSNESHLQNRWQKEEDQRDTEILRERQIQISVLAALESVQPDRRNPTFFNLEIVLVLLSQTLRYPP